MARAVRYFNPRRARELEDPHGEVVLACYKHSIPETHCQDGRGVRRVHQYHYWVCPMPAIIATGAARDTLVDYLADGAMINYLADGTIADMKTYRLRRADYDNPKNWYPAPG